MADSRLLDEDKDEWVYQTINKYSNLYMFDLEFPVDTLEVINESSLCISGLQNYSKKCELLQLCVPPKLLRSEDEEGLCKDRDFKILSGGYAQGKIEQIKAVQKSPDLIATSQEGYTGVVIYQVGDDDRATILEKHRLPTNNSTKINGKSLCCMNDKIILAADPASTAGGILLNEWNIGDGGGAASSTSKSYHIWKPSSTDFKPGSVSKLKSWDGANTSIFLTTNGTLALYDLRIGGETPSIFFHASKSPSNPQNQKPLLADANPDAAAPVIFTFDCLPQENKIGVLDSCGGYETFDPRNVSLSAPSLSSSSSNRCLLPEFSHLAGVYPNWFNIEYEQLKGIPREDVLTSRFIISGVKRECVPVFQEVVNDKPNLSADKGGGSANLAANCDTSVEPVFSHDGHSKPVSHAIWHPVANDLIFSASVDAVLHAWQFIPEKVEKD